LAELGKPSRGQQREVGGGRRWNINFISPARSLAFARAAAYQLAVVGVYLLAPDLSIADNRMQERESLLHEGFERRALNSRRHSIIAPARALGPQWANGGAIAAARLH